MEEIYLFFFELFCDLERESVCVNDMSRIFACVTPNPISAFPIQ